jgi:hypothetical protein
LSAAKPEPVATNTATTAVKVIRKRCMAFSFADVGIREIWNVEPRSTD